MFGVSVVINVIEKLYASPLLEVFKEASNSGFPTPICIGQSGSRTNDLCYIIEGNNSVNISTDISGFDGGVTPRTMQSIKEVLSAQFVNTQERRNDFNLI